VPFFLVNLTDAAPYYTHGLSKVGPVVISTVGRNLGYHETSEISRLRFALSQSTRDWLLEMTAFCQWTFEKPWYYTRPS
jgi:hypothetical protein